MMAHAHRRGLGGNARFDRDGNLVFTGVTASEFQALHAETGKLFQNFQVHQGSVGQATKIAFSMYSALI
jgi:hypothetical protein